MSAPPTGVLFYDGRAKPLSTIGLIQPGAYYQFYLTGTLTLTNIYADGSLVTPLSQTPGTGGTTAASDGRLPAMYANPATIYRYQLYSATGSLLEDIDPWAPVAVPNQAQIGQQLYPQTAAEISAGITPTNYVYPPLYVERYGADPTGVTDSGPGFRAACSVALAAGGGKIYALGALYNFTTWDTVPFQGSTDLALFCIPGSTELIGGGMFFTKLRISSTARSGMYASGTHRTHIIGLRLGQTGQLIHDVQFDYNGIVQQSVTDFCYFIRTMSGGVTIQRCYGIQAPLTNGIVDSSGTATQAGGQITQPVIVRNNWFQDCGPNMTGNTVNTDYTACYLEAPGSIAEENMFFNTAIALGNCGGIEMHSPYYIAQNNFVKNMFPGMYLGVQLPINTISRGSRVTGNYIGYCNSGLSIIDQHYGLEIDHNFMEANVDSAGGGFGFSFGDIFTPSNGVTGQCSAGTQVGLTIAYNTIDMTLFRQGTSRAGVATSAINIGTVVGADISHNKVISAGPNTIIINGSSASTGSAGNAGVTKDVLIEENTFIECTDATGTVGYINIFGTSASGWGAGALFQDIFIRNNHLLRNRSSSLSNAFSFIATGGGTFAPTFTNVRFENNDLVNVNPATDIIGTGASVIVNGASFGTQTIAGSGTIATAGLTAARVTAASAITGVIMQAGTVANQQCTVINEATSANSITMAASGSNVADANGCVIAGSTQKTFYFDINTQLWYHS